MKEECDRHGAELWIVVSDTGMQSHPNVALRDAFMRRRGLPSLDEADLRLQRFCEKNGIHFVALAPPLSQYAVTHAAILHGVGTDNVGHWNRLGNQVVGHLLADELRSHGPMVQTWESDHK